MEVARHPLRAAQDAHTALCFPASRLTVVAARARSCAGPAVRSWSKSSDDVF